MKFPLSLDENFTLSVQNTAKGWQHLVPLFCLQYISVGASIQPKFETYENANALCLDCERDNCSVIWVNTLSGHSDSPMDLSASVFSICLNSTLNLEAVL